MNEDIIKLIALQEVDSEIAGFDRQVSERQQLITDRIQAISDKELKISQCNQQAEDLQQKQHEIKKALEDAQAMIKERQNKMMLVQTSREHQALLKEIEDNKKLIKECEEKILLVMEQIESLEKESLELQNLCNGEKEILEDETSKIEKEIAKVNTRKTTVTNKRNKLSAKLKENILKRYDLLLTKKAGNAVVRTINGVCQGCFMSIPPQQFNVIRKGDTMNMCPTCHRILYYKADEPEAVEG